ncbi:type II/IV secretion system protein [Candidatus Parcubacteria bacterium]|uniref:Bacterial type II secretion system protein E domain-containing protein n=1 Tax=Candidatus Kaiserbacteria bacterium CG10_big_fil_rev_8_21_14_0_10_47_16 TaxID=1974608 RepID=A0A2H0UE18_9BACT|nr:type II/IV secretion system protein [Candidatus Parcubacteria bacterium]PIR84627.1 MAG: hypothetical protein COU16_03575 [Candidatus Kaiserbacteria bacterium CG10_big_fil_rev_8_21_14_0_10_47_16]
MPQFDDTRINQKLESLGHSAEENAARMLAPNYNLGYTNLHGITIDTDALALIPEKVAREAQVAAFLEQNKQLSVAIQNPENPKTEEVLQSLESRGYTITGYLVTLASLDHAWLRYKDVLSATAEKQGVLDISPAAITAFAAEIKTHLDVATKILEVQQTNKTERATSTIEVLFAGALALGASDIHIEPEQNTVRFRYRLDGVLWDITNADKTIYTLITSRIKLLSGLILNIHNEAQDGRFTFDVGTRKIEVRTSVIPGAYGESVVMRLLDPDASGFTLEGLGLNDKLKAVVLEELVRPNGAIITTGPTGSGKTTALYAFMQKVHTPETKIVTIEDPVEYKLPGIVQTQIEEDYTFAQGLRAILRQDPDIIMVGEIRDREVAETAMNAALTGHLVFSTLHTNSAAAAFPRLLDLGVDARTIGSSVNLILGQRLVRLLCNECKVQRDATTQEQTLIAQIMDEPVAQHTIYEPKGCPACGGSGYKGRKGVFEAIRVDTAVEEAVIRDPREIHILAAAKKQDIPSMAQDGIEKVLAGITSLDELERVIDLHNTRTTEEAPDLDTDQDSEDTV